VFPRPRGGQDPQARSDNPVRDVPGGPSEGNCQRLPPPSPKVLEPLAGPEVPTSTLPPLVEEKPPPGPPSAVKATSEPRFAPPVASERPAFACRSASGGGGGVVGGGGGGGRPPPPAPYPFVHPLPERAGRRPGREKRPRAHYTGPAASSKRLRPSFPSPPILPTGSGPSWFPRTMGVGAPVGPRRPVPRNRRRGTFAPKSGLQGLPGGDRSPRPTTVPIESRPQEQPPVAGRPMKPARPVEVRAA